MLSCASMSLMTPARADPPRFRWLKRLLPLAILYVAALLAVRLWWGWEAQRQFEAAVARWRALGQPVTPEDLDREREAQRDPADEIIIEQALALIRLRPEDNEWLGASNFDTDAMRRRLDRFGEIQLRLDAPMRQLRILQGFPNIVWGPTVVDQIANWSGYDFSGLRNLAKGATENALYQLVRGDHQGAVEALQDALLVERVVGGWTPGAIPSMVQSSLGPLITGAVEEIAPALQIEGTRASRAPEIRPANRDSVEALIRSLCDGSHIEQTLARALHFERMYLVATMDAALGGTPTWLPSPFDSAAGRLALAPALRLDACRVARRSAVLLGAWIGKAAAVPTLKISAAPPTPATLRHTVLILSGPYPSYGVLAEWPRRALAGRRMAAAALAIRLYELDHGRRPVSLAELAPDYLPAAPLDPFASEGRPIGYIRDDAHPRLYSVNADGVDDGGRFTLRAGGGVDWRVADLVHFLSREHPRAKTILPDEYPPTQPPP